MPEQAPLKHLVIIPDGNGRWAQNHGLEPIKEGLNIAVNPTNARNIANAYEALPKVDNSPETINSYQALGNEIQKQWDFATQHLGINMEPWVGAGQPYKNSTEMINDVNNNHHLSFFMGGETHPILGQVDSQTGLSLNDKFRAIHDLFGHATEGYQFGPKGEENAWLKHSQMFTPDAQRALTTETRGQNSWVNFGNHNYDELGNYLNTPLSQRPYAEQKTALLPQTLSDWKDLLGEEGGFINLKPQEPNMTQFASPSTKSVQSLQVAQNRLNSSAHTQYSNAIKLIHQKLGIPLIESKNLLGDTKTYGIENSILHSFNSDVPTARYIAAQKGLLGNQFSILNFHHHPEGEDYLVTFKMPKDLTLKQISGILNKAGLDFRSLNPDTNEVHIVDTKGTLAPIIQKLSNQYGFKIKSTEGTAEFIGNDESRASAKSVYGKIIHSFIDRSDQGNPRNPNNRLQESPPTKGPLGPLIDVLKK